jgi:hypothetical protein
MFKWLAGLFAGMDRQTAAAERAAVAAEDIASMIEQARDQLRNRLGIEAPAPVQVAALPPKEEAPAEEPAREAKRKEGRSR